MSKIVTLIDYGSGNLLSVARALEHNGAEVLFANSPEDIAKAERLVLPGVGAFADGMQGLRERHLIEPIRQYAGSGRPLLGICLGMQMLTTTSEEFGIHEGLGLIPGKVRSIPSTSADGSRYKVPHVGWSDLHRPSHANWQGTPLEGTPEGAAVYLVHSFAVTTDDPSDGLAECVYAGNRVCAAIGRGRVFGCQFHPEKSGPAGLAILSRFLAL